MAFGVKYRMDFTDSLGQDDYRIDVEVDGYSDPVIQLGHTFEAFVLTYNEHDWVQGFEGVFSFHLNIEDAAAYDADFYDSEYKTVKIKFYINSALKNVGWLKPENTTRQYHYPVVEYRISFTDALNDLKEIDYVNPDGTTDTLLKIIQRAITLGGLTDFNFFIQCNLREDNLMASTENLFKTFYLQAGAFYSDESNGRRYDKCFDVLEKCIKSFYCRLAQVNGYWQITNGQEHITQRDIYAFSDLSAVSENAAYNRTVDINDKHVIESKFELSKLPPVFRLKLTHLNKYIGTNELANSDFSSGTANWNNGDSVDGWENFTSADGRLVVTEDAATGDPNVMKAFHSDPFTISDIGNGEGFFDLRILLQLAGITYSNGDYASFPPFIAVQLTYPNGNKISSGYEMIREGFNTYRLAFEETFPVNQVGDYFLSVYFIPPNPDGELDSIQLSFDEIILTQNATKSEPVDKVYGFFANQPGFLQLEEEVYVGDGNKASDAGVLMDGSNDFSSAWSRYGFSGEGVTLLELFSTQYLNDRNGYIDLITIEGLIDYDEEIHFNSILILNSKRYRFVEFSKNFKTKTISGTLQQVKNGIDVEFTTLIQSYLSKFKFFEQSATTPPVRGTIPGATSDRAGLVTALPQVWSGDKTFNDGLSLAGSELLDTPLNGKLEYASGGGLFFTRGTVRTRLDSQNLASVASRVEATTGGNVGTGEDILAGHAPNGAGSDKSLLNNGDALTYKGFGTFAANNNTKRIKFHFTESGSAGVLVLYDTGAVAFNDGNWSFEVQIVRVGPNEQKLNITFHATSTGGTPQDIHITKFGTTTHDSEGSTVEFKVTGQATANNDVVLEIMRITFQKQTGD